MTPGSAIKSVGSIGNETPPIPDKMSDDHVSLRSWIAVLTVVLGAFMAVLDIQITNSSLKDIQGAIGASLDEGTWISTSYLIAEIIVIPLTAWLSRVFGMKRYLLFNACLFVIFSMCCGLSWDLPSMITFRALQGFTGGALIPLALNVILTTLPPSKRPIGLALFSVTATFAPTIGPTFGGWLTDNYGWQYIFYLNLLPGIILLASAWFTLPSAKMQLNLLKEGDYLGILAMAIGLSATEFVLEEGNRLDWFGSNLIIQCAIVGAIFLTLFLVIELTTSKPFINLRLAKRHNFGLAAIVNVVLGVGLYGSVYILPSYLTQVQGYSATQIGQVMMWYGLPQLFLIPLVPKLMQKVDTRIIIGVGLILFAASCFVNVLMTHDTGMDQLIVAQLIRAAGQPLIFVPLSSVAMGGIENAEAGSASSLFNMMRNLGGSVGIAAIATFLTQREQFHSFRLGESVSMLAAGTQQRVDQLTQFFMTSGADLTTAQSQAFSALNNIVRRESFVLAYSDCFLLLAVALLASTLVVIFFRKVTPGAAEATAH